MRQGTMHRQALIALLLTLPLTACDGAVMGTAEPASTDSACVTMPEGAYVFANGKFVSADFEGDLQTEAAAPVASGQWRGRIEDDLRQEGYGWLALEGRGGMTFLSGTAPDDAAKSEALAAARAAIQSDETGSAENPLLVDAVAVDGLPAPVGAVLQALPQGASLGQCQQAFEDLKSGRKIDFTGSSEVAESSHALLDAVSGLARLCGGYAIEIGSHTDARGAESYNERLSQARANAIRDYLIEAGVAADRLSAVGYGETQPIDPEQSTQAYARNRRTEFTLSEPGSGDD